MDKGRTPFDVPTRANILQSQRLIEQELREKAARDSKLSPLDKAYAALEAARTIGSGVLATIGSLPTRAIKGEDAAQQYINQRMFIPTTEKGMDYVGNVGDFLEQLETKYKLPPVLPEAVALQNLVGPASKQAAKQAVKTAKPVVGKALEEYMFKQGLALPAAEPSFKIPPGLKPSEKDKFVRVYNAMESGDTIPRSTKNVQELVGDEKDVARSLLTDPTYKQLGQIPIEDIDAALSARKRYRSEPAKTPGKNASEQDWAKWGEDHGVNMTRTPDVSLGITDLTSKREVKIPGGLEGTFTIPDLFHIKAQNINPASLPKDVHDQLMKKFIRTHNIENPDEVDIFNRLNFALLSPNAPLTPNEFLAQRARLVNKEELQALASRVGEQNLAQTAGEQLGVGAAGRGGMGVAGTANLGNQATLAKLILEKPEMFKIQPGETMRDVTMRVMNQVPGLGPKTASLGTPWLDLNKANTSAVDLHMIRNSYKRMLDDPEVGEAFRERMGSLLKTEPTTEAILNIDPKKVEDAAIGIIGGTDLSRMYRLKTGELNKIPASSTPDKLAYEPKSFREFNPFYNKVVDYVDESRGANPVIELFPEQWRKWDIYRQRIEPHEFAHPDFRKLPRQSWSEMADSLSAHKEAGYTQANDPVMKDSDWRKLYYGRVSPEALLPLGAASAGALALEKLNQDKPKEKSVHISDNPDAMMMELEDQKFVGGGIAKAAKSAAKAAVKEPAVNRLDMNFKDVTKRIPELTEAANMVAKGQMTASEYALLVQKLKPVTPYNFVPQPATTEDAMRALTENKKPMFGKTKEMAAGEQADLRLDIPAYKDHGVWVNSIHRKDQPTVYGSTSSVKNATMIGAPEKAMKVAQGGPKAPFAVIRGDWNPMDESEAIKNAQKYLDHPDWKQVGYDPERHGYFYDRTSMAPVISADEVIQIGPLVLAKKPKYGNPDDFAFKSGGAISKDQGFATGGMIGKAVKSAIAARELEKQAILRAEAAAKSAAKQALMPQYNEAVKGQTQKQNPPSFEQWKAANVPQKQATNYPQEEALRLAQQRAALPIEQGGLGLPANNTAAERAAAMGFDLNNNYVHSTSKPFDKIKEREKFSGIFTLPNYSANYGNVDMPLVARGEIASNSDLRNLSKNPSKQNQRAIDQELPRNITDPGDIADALVEMQRRRNELARKLGYSGVEMNDEFGDTISLVSPDNVRSLFAAFDPFRRDLATAAAMGVLAPDLLAEEKKAGGGDVNLDAMYMAVNDAKFRRK